MLQDLRANSFFTMLRTWLHGELVAVDDYGNRYYRERGYRDRRAPGWRTERRWVVFNRDADPTRVPTGWVGWLHGRIDMPPSEQPRISPARPRPTCRPARSSAAATAPRRPVTTRLGGRSRAGLVRAAELQKPARACSIAGRAM